MWALVNGVFTGLGAWTLMAAMAAGGKASLVMPITAMYPLLVVLVAPVVFPRIDNGPAGSGCCLRADQRRAHIVRRARTLKTKQAKLFEEQIGS